MPNPLSHTATRLMTACAPVALTPLLFWLLAEGHLNLGGGEKDILLTVPWLLWSLAFLIPALWNWRKHRPLAQALGSAALVATALLLLLGTIVLFVSFRSRSAPPKASSHMRFPFPCSTWRVVLCAALWIAGTAAIALALSVRNVEALPHAEQSVGISLFMDGLPRWVFSLIWAPALLLVVWRLLWPRSRLNNVGCCLTTA